MDRHEEQIAHELETILQDNLHKHKTALQRRFIPNLPIRHPQRKVEMTTVGWSLGSVVSDQGTHLRPRATDICDAPHRDRT